MKFISRILLLSFVLQLFFSFETPTYANNNVSSIEIQSGLEIGDNSEYFCKKEDCKLNLSTHSYLESMGEIKDYHCKWDFGGGTWKTANTDTKCNPGYVSYTPGKYSVSLTVFKKEDDTIVNSSTLVFENNFYPEGENSQESVPESQEEVGEENTHSGELNQNIKKQELVANSTSSGSVTQTGSFEISHTGSQETNTSSGGTIETSTGEIDINNAFIYPDVIIEIQSGLEESENGNYLCKKEGCKVNLSLEKYLELLPQENKYNCSWMFGSGTWTTENTDKKCNPGYVVFGTGEHQIQSNILSDGVIVASGSLIFENTFYQLNDISEPILYIDQENITSSGTIIGDVKSHSGVINSLTGGLAIHSGSLSLSATGSKVELPEINIQIQSGLEKTGTGEIYNCKKEDCKVNLTMEHIFTGSYLGSDYKCLWNFGSGSYSTGTHEKCNPGYVRYGSGAHEILLTLSSSINPDKFATGSLKFTHDFEKESDQEISKQIIPEVIKESGQKTIQTTSGSIDTTTVIQEAVIEDFIDSRITFKTEMQQPSYVQSGVGNTFICDTSKVQCKINFKFQVEHPTYNPATFICRINTGVKEKRIDTCNPATLVFPTGDHILELDILERETLRIVSKNEIQIINTGYVVPVKSRSSQVNASVNKKIAKKLKISTPEIEIQSGLDENLKCKKEDCKVNLIYNKEKGEKCEWQFPGGEYKKSTITKCNPGYISYRKLGSFRAKLKVYDSNYPHNYKTQTLDFTNQEATTAQEDEKQSVLTEENMLELLSESIITDFHISLQGKKTSFRSMSGSDIFCTQSPCNINLDGSKSKRSDNSKIDLIWNFGSSEYKGNNPKALWFESGKHTISVRDAHNTHLITVTVVDTTLIKDSDAISLEKERETTQDRFQYDKNLIHALEIYRVIPNPKGVDSDEYIEIINRGNLALNLKNLFIDDEIGGGSKAYVVSHDQIIRSGEIQRLYKSATKLNLNNSNDSVNLSYSGVVFDSISWNYSIPDNHALHKLNTELERNSVVVQKIIDGDTYIIKFLDGTTETIRLVGVDTPEIYNPVSSLEKKYGLAAKKYAEGHLLGQTVHLEYESADARDKYGRILGYIYTASGENFNQSLISNGHSRAYLAYEFKHSVSFKKSESIAKKNKVGIWSNLLYKKQVLSSIRTDSAVRESLHIKKSIKESDLFYTDANKNKIPDSFEMQTENHLSGEVDDYDFGRKQYYDFIDSNYYIKTSKLISGIKLSGKTVPDSKLNFKIGEKSYETFSGKDGSFTYLIGHDFSLGEYQILSSVVDHFGNTIEISNKKLLEIDAGYISKLKISRQKKALALARKLAKQNKKKSSTKRAKASIIHSSIFIQQAKAYGGIDDGSTVKYSNILTFLIFILSCIMIFFLFRKKKLV